MMKNEMIPIHSSLISNLDKAPCDLYLRMPLNNKDILLATANSEIPNSVKKMCFQDVMIYSSMQDSVTVFDHTFDSLQHAMKNEIKNNENVKKHIQAFNHIHEYALQLFKKNYNHDFNNNGFFKTKDLIFNYLNENSVMKDEGLKNELFRMKMNKSLELMILSMSVAHELGYNTSKMEMLIASAFLCDIGQTENDHDVDEHISKSAIMTRLVLNKTNNKLLANHGDTYLGVLHHHEYINGSGAFELVGDKIHPFGLIIRTVEDYLIDKTDFFTGNPLVCYEIYDMQIYETLRKIIMKK